MILKLFEWLKYLWLALLFALIFFILQTGLGVRDHMIYPGWNFFFLSGAAVLCGAAFLFASARLRFTYLAASFSFVLTLVAASPFHEVDRLFYGNLAQIRGTENVASIEEKIELCDHIKSYYLNLKSQMILDLEQTCSQAVIDLSHQSKAELNQAFEWAYAEYVRKPHHLQAKTLACLYADTDQKDFAVQLSEKHSLPEVMKNLKTSGHCFNSHQRSIASVDE